MFWNHFELQEINRAAARHGAAEPRHVNLRIPNEDNGEKFFGAYLMDQRRRNRTYPKHRSSKRCQCCQCAANPVPLCSIQESATGMVAGASNSIYYATSQQIQGRKAPPAILPLSMPTTSVVLQSTSVPTNMSALLPPFGPQMLAMPAAYPSTVQPIAPSNIPYELPIPKSKRQRRQQELAKPCCDGRAIQITFGLSGRSQHTWPCRIAHSFAFDASGNCILARPQPDQSDLQLGPPI